MIVYVEKWWARGMETDYKHTVNSGAQVPVLLFGDCVFARYGMRGVPTIMGYFSTRKKIQ